jgi:hypothetical protein
MLDFELLRAFVAVPIAAASIERSSGSIRRSRR